MVCSPCVLQGLNHAACHPTIKWQPFVIKVELKPDSVPPAVRALSNSTWCSTRAQQLVASRIINDGLSQATNGKLYRVDSKAGTHLLLVNLQTKLIAGGALDTPDEEGEWNLHQIAGGWSQKEHVHVNRQGHFFSLCPP